MSSLPNDWQIYTLEQLTEPDRPISYGVVQTGDPVENGIPCVRVVDLTSGNLDPQRMITTSIDISSSYKRTILRKDDLMLALRGEIGFTVKVPPELVGANLTRGIALIAPKKTIALPDFLLQALRSDVVLKDILDHVNGSALKEIPIGNLRKVIVPLPPLPEQRAIAAILSTWDEAITLTERLIAALRRRKQALMQMLLMGEVRFPGFEGEWSVVQLKDSFDRITRPIVEELENVLSITATKGFVDQKSKFGRTIAGKNLEKYIHLKHGEFAYNKGNSNTYPQGCIYRLKEFQEGAVPNVYYCFSARSETTNGDYFKYYFESGALNEQLSRLINSGVRNDGLLNLSADNFFAVEILVPPLLEQEQVAAILSYADSALKDVTQMLNALRIQKHGLMQQLLTGAIRVQVEE